MLTTRADEIVTLGQPPEGYEVNFEHPQRRADVQTYWCFGVGNLLALIFLAQRFYTKLRIVKSFQLDDGLATQLLCIYIFFEGVGGVHYYEISVAQPSGSPPSSTPSPAASPNCPCWSSTSASRPKKSFRYLVAATMAFIASYTIGLFFSFLFSCDPMRRSWDVLETEGKCINQAALYIATAVANIVSDVILFVLPIPLVVKLHMPKMQKIGLFFVFAIGSATVVTSIIRTAILPTMLTDPDQTWAISFATMWIVIEANLLVICGNMTTLRRFFRHVAPKVIGYSSEGSKGRTGKGSAYMPGYASGSRSARRQTFRPRDPYERFEGENELRTFTSRAPSPYGNSAKAEAGAASSNTTWDERKGSHDDGGVRRRSSYRRRLSEYRMTKKAYISGQEKVQRSLGLIC
ncbi:Satratoxin biosynthesis SC1 cluster protein 4 [Apiospora rasikravindrae]|uniref:Satratoxin biosynthesis SC1 cluster protein 4 n=1 Tax=Apiospora rasikravindrae TaxID=990691 RepID=A0ABR1TC60_9PEZI